MPRNSPSRKSTKARRSKGAPISAPAVSRALGNVAKNPPTISKDGVSLGVVNDGGDKSTTEVVFDEDADVFINSGDKGILGREVSLVSLDGQSNNALWQQLARRLIQQDKVDVLVAGFASAEREAIRPIVDQFKQLYFYTNQYEGGVADANTFCTGPVCEQQVIPVVQYMVEKFGPRGLHAGGRLQLRPVDGGVDKSLRAACRRPDHRRRIRAALGFRIQPGHRARSASQAGLGDDAARRPEPVRTTIRRRPPPGCKFRWLRP